MRSPLDREKSPIGNLAYGRNRDRLFTREVRTRQALTCLCQVVDRPLSDDFTSLDTGPGPKVDQVIGARMVSSSCSTTTTVLPSSASRRNVASNRSLSCGCNPIDGSSRM